MKLAVALVMSASIFGPSAASAQGLQPGSSPASTQAVPDLKGTWKGTAYAVHIGPNPYRPADRAGPIFAENAVEFTYRIEDQVGSRFAGTSSSGNRTETFIGALRPDNTGGIFLDDDGHYSFTIRDRTTLDVCYSHSFPTSKVASCWTLTRSP